MEINLMSTDLAIMKWLKEVMLSSGLLTTSTKALMLYYQTLTSKISPTIQMIRSARITFSAFSGRIKEV